MTVDITIAQALRKVKKLKGLVAEHQQRAVAGVSYDVEKVPSFRFEEQTKAMKAAKDEMVDLESRVAVANATSLVMLGTDSMTLAKAIRSMQEIKGEIVFLKGLNLRNETIREREVEWSDTELKSITRYKEVKFVSDLSEQDRDKQIKDLQNRFDDLNNLVETANHKVSV